MAKFLGRMVRRYRARPVKSAVLTLIALGLIVLVIWTAWGNTARECNTYTVTSAKLPAAFDGFRIAQVSDLHNDVFGDKNETLLTMLRSAEPDMIAITGDLIDSYDTDIAIALEFAQEAVKIAPCYFVAGNHEPRYDNWRGFLQALEQVGVQVLYDERAVIEKNGEKIGVIGINDPVFETYSNAEVEISSLMEEDEFAVLLSHRPELMADFSAARGGSRSQRTRPRRAGSTAFCGRIDCAQSGHFPCV